MPLRSSDLMGLMAPAEGSPSDLVTLILNNTAVDDEASPFLASCISLVTLQLAGTKISSKLFFTLLDKFPTNENVRSCRTVSSS